MNVTVGPVIYRITCEDQIVQLFGSQQRPQHGPQGDESQRPQRSLRPALERRGPYLVQRQREIA